MLTTLATMMIGRTPTKVVALCHSSRVQSVPSTKLTRWFHHQSPKTGRVATFSTDDSNITGNSPTNALVSTHLCHETKIATITMHRKPANSLSLEMCQALSNAIRTVEDATDPTPMEALILTSSLPNGIFSAGLDLAELYRPDPVRLPQFWNAFQQVYLDLYGTRLSTLAAMDGHAPAAGCMLALSCDYRIMTSNPKVTIGLNESQLGIVAPPWLCRQYIDTIGQRRAELSLLLGTLYSPQDALAIELVDELAPPNGTTTTTTPNDDALAAAVDSASTAVTAAKIKALEFVKIPSKARVAAKQLTRGPQIQYLLENRNDDNQFFCSYVTDDSVQITLGTYLERLAKRKK